TYRRFAHAGPGRPPFTGGRIRCRGRLPPLGGDDEGKNRPGVQSPDSRDAFGSFFRSQTHRSAVGHRAARSGRTVRHLPAARLVGIGPRQATEIGAGHGAHGPRPGAIAHAGAHAGVVAIVIADSGASSRAGAGAGPGGGDRRAKPARQETSGHAERPPEGASGSRHAGRAVAGSADGPADFRTQPTQSSYAGGVRQSSANGREPLPPLSDRTPLATAHPDWPARQAQVSRRDFRHPQLSRRAGRTPRVTIFDSRDMATRSKTGGQAARTQAKNIASIAPAADRDTAFYLYGITQA